MVGCLILALAACGGDPGGNAVDKAADVQEAKNEPVELTFFNINSQGITQEQFMEEYGNMISKRFPNFSLKNITNPKGNTADNLNQLVTAGQTFDILISSIDLTAKFLIPMGLQNDIGDLIKQTKYDLNKLEPSAVESQKLMANGSIYGLPVYNSTAVLYYNKDLFDKFGVAYPKNGMTWDDLYDLARKMTRTEGGVQYKGLTIDMIHTLTVDALSTPWVDIKTYKSQLAEESFIRAFKNLVRFFQIPGNELPGSAYGQGKQLDAFIKDKTSAMLLGMNNVALNKIQDNVNWDVVQLPYYTDKIGTGPQPYPTYFYISSNSQHRNAAFQVLDYVTSDEYQMEENRKGILPILKDTSKYISEFGSESPFFKGKNIKGFIPGKLAEPALKTAFDDEAKAQLNGQMIGDVANGKIDVNTALREAAERADKAIAEERTK
jgi:multiple sugar transport system substrate-binding protein